MSEMGSGALTDFMFTGHYQDRPTGLALTWFRGYDPNLGRWLSQDPLGIEGGLNLYGYVNSDPLAHVDPLGLEAKCKVECRNPEAIGCESECRRQAEHEFDVCMIRFDDDFDCQNIFNLVMNLCMRGCPRCRSSQ